MSTIDFKNMYLVSVVLVLLFGIGLGYQINTWTNTNDGSEIAITTSENTQSGTQASSSPKAIQEVYARTGRVEAISPDSITFTTILQNSDSSYSESTLIAQLSDSTVYTKINLQDTSQETETISYDDISIGSEVAISASDNIYGRSTFNAISVQLHQF